MTDKRSKIKQLMDILYNMDVQYARAVKVLGFKASMFWFLYALDNNEPTSQKQMIVDRQVPKTTLNTIVKECERKGYITFENIKGEKREKVVVATEAGRKYAQDMLQKIYAAEEEAINNTKDIDKLLELINIYYKNIEKSFSKIINRSQK